MTGYRQPDGRLLQLVLVHAMRHVPGELLLHVSHSTVCTASNLKSQDIAQEGLPIFRLDISADAVCHFAQPFWRETAESFRGAKVLLYSAHSCMNFS